LADALDRWESLALAESEGRELIRSVSVVKLGHHGAQSTSEDLLKAAAPAATILSTGVAGKGTTGEHRFPEKAVIERLTSYFSETAKQIGGDGKKIGGRTIPACSESSTEDGLRSCSWKQLPLPPTVWSTAVSGTIDMFVKKKRLCVETQLLTERIEFRF
jgi:hypothetical protein